MPKSLRRFVAVLLAPSLIPSSGWAASPLDFPAHSIAHAAIFAAEALSPRGEVERAPEETALNRTPNIHLSQATADLSRRMAMPVISGMGLAGWLYGQTEPWYRVKLDLFNRREEESMRFALELASRYITGLTDVIADPDVTVQIVQVQNIPNFLDTWGQQKGIPLLRQWARLFREQARKGRPTGAVTVPMPDDKGHLIFLTLVQPDVFTRPGHLIGELFHELNHVVQHYAHKAEILRRHYTFDRAKIEADNSLANIASMQALLYDTRYRDVPTADLMAIGGPGGEIDDEKDHIAYWNSERPVPTSWPLIVNGEVSVALGALGALALCRSRRIPLVQALNRVHPRAVWKEALLWTIAIGAIVGGILAVLQGMNRIPPQ